MNRPLLFVTLSFVIGIFLNSIIIVNPRVIFGATLAVLGVALVGFIITWRENRWVFVLLFILLGWTMAAVDAIKHPDDPVRYAGHYVSLEGVIDREPQIISDSVRYILKTDTVIIGDAKSTAAGYVQVNVEGKGPVYTYGERLRVRGYLYQPYEPGNFGAFNYRDYLERRGIYSLMKVKGPDDVILVGAGGGNVIAGLALYCKQKLLQVAVGTLDGTQAAVLNGMLFGSREGIDNEIKDLFAQTGISHVLCVSGLHVGYVLAAVILFAGLLRAPGRAIPFIVLPVLVFYAFMTGMGPAVMRASIMAMVVLAGVQLGRERDWPTALALAAAIILVPDPSYLYEIGFQLSFTATWGILYLGPLLGEFLQNKCGFPNWLRLPLQVTVAAQLGTLPLVIYYFNLVVPVAPLANLLIVPLVGLIMLTGFLGCFLGIFFLPLAEFINAGTGMLINFFLWLAELVGSLPGSSSYVATPSLYAVVTWYGGLFLLVETIKGHINFPWHTWVNKKFSVGIVVLIILVACWPWNGTGGKLALHFIDVGQGDSILVCLPGGRTMLVDAGGRMGGLEEGRVVGDKVVVPYLHRLGIDKLDVLVVTHPHGDHAGGAVAVAEKLSVGAVVISGSEGYEELLSHLTPLHIPIFQAGAGQAMQIDDKVEVMVLAPSKEMLAGDKEDFNNDSLVLRLEYNDFSLLLTGDIEEEAQRDILAGGMILQTDVLKVPHHGSRFFAPEFFKVIAPEYAVIQVGANNRFGHPAPETLNALKNTGAQILRTDEDGAIMIITDGHRVSIKKAK